ncbi:hypothetical protein TNCV_425731 [Trichonephila clavipes]|nr:hypothetical protein TNCV_425731 [Trichonephila clavipes]
MKTSLDICFTRGSNNPTKRLKTIPPQSAPHSNPTDEIFHILCAPRKQFRPFHFIKSTNCRQLRLIQRPESGPKVDALPFISAQPPPPFQWTPPPLSNLIIFHCPGVDKLLTGKLRCISLPQVENVPISGSDYGLFQDTNCDRLG